MNQEPFFAAKCIFRHHHLDPIDGRKFVYEERVVLIQADDFDEAIEKAEKEAKEYSDFGTEYLEYINVYHLCDYILRSGSELYSEMRSSDLEPEAYISYFLDTGLEHSRDKI